MKHYNILITLAYLINEQTCLLIFEFRKYSEVSNQQECLFFSGKIRLNVWNVQFVFRQLILFQFINVWMGTLFAKIVTQSWRIVQFAEMTSTTTWRSGIGNLRKSWKGIVLNKIDAMFPHIPSFLLWIVTWPKIQIIK